MIFDVLVIGAAFLPNPPVGHREALESPFATENRVNKVEGIGVEDAVDAVIRSHNPMRFGLFNSHFESTEVDFAKGFLGNDGIAAPAMAFLVIAGKVLNRCGTTGILNAFDIGNGE